MTSREALLTICFFSSTSFGFFSSCHTSPIISGQESLSSQATNQSTNQNKNDVKNQSLEQLTFSGNNFRPQTSVDGLKLLFVSQNRVEHEQAQLYELALETKKQKRVTYQDGQVIGGFYHTKSRDLFYVSSTDEDKESPAFLRHAKERIQNGLPIFAADELERIPQSLSTWLDHWTLLGTEIYRGDETLSKIDRLTHHSGFDGWPHLHPDGQKLIFVSQQNKNWSLYTKDLHRRLLVSHAQSTHPLYSPKWHPTGNEFLYLESTPTGTLLWHYQLKNKRRQVLLESKTAIHSATWSLDGQGILLSAKLLNEQEDLFWLKVESQCLLPLTNDSYQNIFPEFLGEQNIVFSSNRAQNFQLFRLALPDTADCTQASSLTASTLEALKKNVSFEKSAAQSL